MKKFINPTAIFYIAIIIVITLLIGFASGGNSKNSQVKIIKINKLNNIMITLETSLGNIDLELYPDAAPKTVENFIKLSKDGFYENTKFHRVIKGFMIQGGDPYTKGEDVSVYGTGGPGYKFADEANDLPMTRGMLAMANSGPNTNGSQFFITTVEAPWLQGVHTIFGRVISGMEVVDKIEAVKTTGDPYNRPVTPVVVNKIIIK
jgi:peptidyl-prolyl cis-trans isomerase B (cyclophilin B)